MRYDQYAGWVMEEHEMKHAVSYGLCHQSAENRSDWMIIPATYKGSVQVYPVTESNVIKVTAIAAIKRQPFF